MGFFFCVWNVERAWRSKLRRCSWNEIWLQWEKDWMESEKCLRGGDNTCRSVTKRDRTPDCLSNGPAQDKMLKWWCDVTVTSFYWQFWTDPIRIILSTLFTDWLTCSLLIHWCCWDLNYVTTVGEVGFSVLLDNLTRAILVNSCDS